MAGTARHTTGWRRAVVTAAGAPDDLGRPGRVLQLSCGPGVQQSYGLWPGSFYSVPLAALVVTGLIAAGAALRVVARRPRTGADPGAIVADDALRHRAARAITGACGILVALPLAGTCLVTAGTLLSFSCRPAWWTSGLISSRRGGGTRVTATAPILSDSQRLQLLHQHATAFVQQAVLLGADRQQILGAVSQALTT